MADYTSSPNMNLPIPTVSTAPGPTYAELVDQCLTLLDGHTHGPGSGVPIGPDGLNINAELDFQGNFAVSVAGVNFDPQGGVPQNGTIYMSSDDLYFADGAGNNVRLTQSGAVAGTPGSISNLVAPASAAYVALSSTFVWQSNTNIAANMDFGAAIMRNLSPNSTFALTLRPPAALANDFTLTLPTIPGATSFMQLDTSGNMSATIPVSGGLTASNIATGTQIPLVIQNITAVDTVAVNTGLALCATSSSDYTVTLYTPVGHSGYRVRLRKDSSASDFSIVTISGTGLSTTLNTNGEELEVISDGANWQVLSRVIPNNRQDYTPSTTNLGTVSSINMSCWRDGSDLLITGYIVLGTVTNALGKMSLPSGLTADNTAMAGVDYAPVGLIGSATNNTANYVLYNSGDLSYLYFGSPFGSGTVMAAPVNSNVSFTNGASQKLGIIRVPIAGWKS